jgi:uroporphyrinogen decarboxylase
MYEETDYALMGNTYPMWTFHIGLELFGYHKFFLLMAAQPEIVHAWMDMSTNAWLATMDKYLDAVGPYIVAIVVGDDYGTQRAPMISPKMFRELFKPSLARICDFVHKKSPNVKVLLHSCGAVAPLIPDFIDAGLDALNPVQTTAEGMDPTKLKAEYGRDLGFWGGGVRCQTTLANGTVEDVKSEVRELLEIWKPGGGYIFAPDHDIQENVPAEKIIAVYEAAQKYGGY